MVGLVLWRFFVLVGFVVVLGSFLVGWVGSFLVFEGICMLWFVGGVVLRWG